MISKSILKSNELPGVRLVLKRSQQGTKKLFNQYGERLICVRYRYDPIRKQRIKTVELTIEKSYWKPETYQRFFPDFTAGIQVHYHESDIRQTVKSAGGRWNPVHKLWEFPLSTIFELDLEDRIVTKEDLDK